MDEPMEDATNGSDQCDLPQRALVQFCNEDGDLLGAQVELPLSVDRKRLLALIHVLVPSDQDDPAPYNFFVNQVEVRESLQATLQQLPESYFTGEQALKVTCVPQATYRVQTVTRCSASIPGHAEAVLAVAFSADGSRLASGSGDTTVRLWDVKTQTPQMCLKGHTNWVLCIAWAPDGRRLASGCKSGRVCVWDAETGKQVGRTMSGHSKWINALAWEPLHSNPECRRLASASKDGTVKIWDVQLGQALFTLSSHTMAVTCVKWGGTNLIYTSSQDQTIKIWRSKDGTLQQTLTGHGHWVNSLALSTDYAMRLGTFDPEKKDKSGGQKQTVEQTVAASRARYDAARGDGERLVSCSDDFTLFLYKPETHTKPIARMTGHAQPVNDVRFSPDARFIASASFDKSVRLWDGKSGKFVCTLRGHVSQVFQLAWSSDSRLLVSGSSDSTLKVWNVAKQKIWMDLPGHDDQVYAVDWSPNGDHVASGGKDKLLKLWQK